MSRCLICPDHPELENDEMLVHLRDNHGLVDALDLEPAATRSRRKRVIALSMILVAVIVAGIALFAYLGFLVRVFSFTA